MNKKAAFFLVLVFISACSSYRSLKLDELYGVSLPREREVQKIDQGKIDYWQDVKPILDSRCIVCHACYDAPCQAKFTAPEGVVRGATKARIYHPERFSAAPLTRLFEDAQSAQEWRDKKFFPLLNEHQDTSVEANREASVLYQMLQLKKFNPLPDSTILSNDFTLGINRKETCPTEDSFPEFSQKHPLWGMPYAFPALSDSESNVLMRWIDEGAEYPAREPLSAELQESVASWEKFLNQENFKSQLSSRYIYEHLFIAHIYFNTIDQRQFFKLVRSKTPPGTPVERIATRRPYDDPGVARVYYRLVRENESIVVKTHLPYAFNRQRMQQWQALFHNTAYTVEQLPDYTPETTGNPFIAFKALPVASRYSFLLDEALFSIMNFIKGPVCRGQTALNVIRDHFWVFFVSPDFERTEMTVEFLQTQKENFELPSARGDIKLPVSNWVRYSGKQKKLLQARDEFLSQEFKQHPTELGLDLVWDGGGINTNAALTVFRNFDSATVEKGLIGQPPRTAWLISYPLLERIHYLLVAGYDVYGNVGHQLFSRLYMDFLRMEGEANFLMLLPAQARIAERNNWYREASKRTLEYISHPILDDKIEPNIKYSSANPKLELYDKLHAHLDGALSTERELHHFPEDINTQLKKLSKLKGKQTRFLSHVSLIIINDGAKQYHATLIKNVAHLNITSMFNEYNNMIESENTVTVTRGIVGSYPNTLLNVERNSLGKLVQRLETVSSNQSYRELINDYGIRRTNPEFWSFSDKLHATFLQDAPVEAGYLDYSRFENR